MWKLIVIILGVVVAGVSVLIACLRTDENHVLTYILVVVVDVLYFWFLITVLNLEILPKQKLLKLHGGNKSCIKGEIVDVSQTTTRVQGIDCWQVTVGQESQRVLFVPDVLVVEQGRVATICSVSNIVVEVTY